MMFDQQRLAQEIFNLSKNYWSTTMGMVSNFQDQNEKMWNNLIEQGVVTQQESKKMLQEWMNRARQAREEFTKTIDDNWKNTERTFSSAPKTVK